MATNSIKLLTGNSHGQLAKLVADRYEYAQEGVKVDSHADLEYEDWASSWPR